MSDNGVVRIASDNGPVQPHWLPQRAPTGQDVAGGQVVLLTEARQARAVRGVLGEVRV